MTMDYDRYLRPERQTVESQLVRKAYSEWSSYCYAAFTTGSPSNVRRHTDPDISITTNSADHGSNGEGDTRYSGYSYSPRYMRGDVGILGCDKCNCGGYDDGLDWDSDSSGDSAEMPRQGHAFGSRLSWPRANCELPRRTRICPALGVNGLKKCFGPLSSQDILTSKSKRIIETFPKCITPGNFSSRTSPLGVERSLSPVVQCDSCNSLEVDMCQTELRKTVTVQQTRIVTSSSSSLSSSRRSSSSSSIVLGSFSDAIEECSSSEEDSEVADVFETPPPEGRSRKVSFADESGGSLVELRVFERDDSPVTFRHLPEPGGIPEEFDDDEDDDDDGYSFTTMADISFKVINRDIDNIKNILQKHRQFFEDLRKPPSPTSDGDDGEVGSSDIQNCDTNTKFINFQPETLAKSLDDGCHVALYDLQPVSDHVVSGCVCTLPRSSFTSSSSTSSSSTSSSSTSSSSTSSSSTSSSSTDVFIRWTTDAWKTTNDTAAYLYHELKPPRHKDTFKFNIDLASRDEVHCSDWMMELAVCSRTPEGEFWDNNGGHNYKIKL